jgi:hypothetical protein
MDILILTNSMDGSSNIIVDILDKKKILIILDGI